MRRQRRLSEGRPGPRRSAAVLCALAVLTAGCESAAALGAPSVREAAEPGSAPAPRRLRFLPSGPRDPARQMLRFKQLAKEATDVQVMNSDASFVATRLPATFVATFAGGDVCTATLIGPRAILTAAHCVDQKFQDDHGRWLTISGEIALSGEGVPRKIKSCEMAPAYVTTAPSAERTPRNAHDFALCELDRDVPLMAETLDLSAGKTRASARLLIAGFGCDETVLVNGAIPDNPKTSGTLRVGMSTMPGTVEDGWVTSVAAVGQTEAIVCPGDSGGAVYANVDLRAPKDKGWRVVALNSAVEAVKVSEPSLAAGPPAEAPPKFRSFLSPIADPAFLAFARCWTAQSRSTRRLCGIDLDPYRGNCRL